MSLGDSKTQAGSWQPTLSADLVSAGYGTNSIANAGVGGQTVALAAGSIATLLAMVPHSEISDYAICDWGVNDVYAGVLPDEATWKANYLSIIDAIHANAPGAKVYLAFPWMQGRDTQCDTLATWISWVVAQRPGIAVAGMDERVWFKPNVATYSTDGIHWSGTPAGVTAGAAAWQAAMGY